MNETIIELRQIAKQFRSPEGGLVDALYPADLNIYAGEFFTLLGSSGCGKSTTLRMIAGFETPSSGDILINGQSVLNVPPYRRAVNMVFQDYALFPHLTVAKNVEFGLEMKKIPKSERDDRVQAALDMVRLTGLERRRTNQLSGGQRQRVALARALVNEPSVLLLDEPLGALDLKLRRAMQTELKQLQQQVGITFVYVTHDQEEALVMSDRIAVMDNGRFLQVDTPQEIYEHPSTRFVADFIGETNFISGTLNTHVNEVANVQIGSQAVGVSYRANGIYPGDPVTLAIRPEKLRLAQPAQPNDAPLLNGTLEQALYMGTDTRFVVRIETGDALVVREQNHNSHAPFFPAIGDAVKVQFTANDARILTD
ncbi:MAG: ABC transporter ATP-binding protein [Chloroflexota bacterium]